MATLLVDIKETIDETKPDQDHLDEQRLLLFEKRYDELIVRGLERDPFVAAEVAEGKPKKEASQSRLPPTIF